MYLDTTNKPFLNRGNPDVENSNRKQSLTAKRLASSRHQSKDSYDRDNDLLQNEHDCRGQDELRIKEDFDSK